MPKKHGRPMGPGAMIMKCRFVGSNICVNLAFPKQAYTVALVYMLITWEAPGMLKTRGSEGAKRRGLKILKSCKSIGLIPKKNGNGCR